MRKQSHRNHTESVTLTLTLTQNHICLLNGSLASCQSRTSYAAPLLFGKNTSLWQTCVQGPWTQITERQTDEKRKGEGKEGKGEKGQNLIPHLTKIYFVNRRERR